MKKRSILTFAAFGVALSGGLLAGCGGQQEEAATTPGGTAGAPPAAKGGPLPPGVPRPQTMPLGASQAQRSGASSP